MSQIPVFFGVLRYEFWMQFRRRALWITIICFILFISWRGFGGIFRELIGNPFHFQLLPFIADWTSSINAIFPIAIGVLLADRLPRDRRTKVDELFTTMPGKLSTRLVGKYLGSTLATLIPVFAIYSIGIGCILYQNHDLSIIPMALATFAVIALPGILFVGAFSIACPSLLWVPLYQFLFVGYWFWGNLLSPRVGIPTLSKTILTPIGGYMATGFFGDPYGQPGATPLQGVESIILLLGITVLVMVTLWGLMKWQQARQ